MQVPDPFFNEPGWESYRSDARYVEKSEAYNVEIRCVSNLYT